jgi:hypothetical protein
MSGEAGRALATIDAAIESAERNGARFQLSELLRMRAEVLDQGRRRDNDEIELALRAAIESARSQGALMSELRAVTRLATHFAEKGRRLEASELLQPYAEFIRTNPGSSDTRAAAELL